MARKKQRVNMSRLIATDCGSDRHHGDLSSSSSKKHEHEYDDDDNQEEEALMPGAAAAMGNKEEKDAAEASRRVVGTPSPVVAAPAAAAAAAAMTTQDEVRTASSSPPVEKTMVPAVVVSPDPFLVTSTSATETAMEICDDIGGEGGGGRRRSFSSVAAATEAVVASALFPWSFSGEGPGEKRTDNAALLGAAAAARTTPASPPKLPCLKPAASATKPLNLMPSSTKKQTGLKRKPSSSSDCCCGGCGGGGHCDGNEEGWNDDSGGSSINGSGGGDGSNKNGERSASGTTSGGRREGKNNGTVDLRSVLSSCSSVEEALPPSMTSRQQQQQRQSSSPSWFGASVSFGPTLLSLSCDEHISLLLKEEEEDVVDKMEEEELEQEENEAAHPPSLFSSSSEEKGGESDVTPSPAASITSSSVGCVLTVHRLDSGIADIDAAAADDDANGDAFFRRGRRNPPPPTLDEVSSLLHDKIAAAFGGRRHHRGAGDNGSGGDGSGSNNNSSSNNIRKIVAAGKEERAWRRATLDLFLDRDDDGSSSGFVGGEGRGDTLDDVLRAVSQYRRVVDMAAKDEEVRHCHRRRRRKKRRTVCGADEFQWWTRPTTPEDGVGGRRDRNGSSGNSAIEEEKKNEGRRRRNDDTVMPPPIPPATRLRALAPLRRMLLPMAVRVVNHLGGPKRGVDSEQRDIAANDRNVVNCEKVTEQDECNDGRCRPSEAVPPSTAEIEAFLPAATKEATMHLVSFSFVDALLHCNEDRGGIEECEDDDNLCGEALRNAVQEALRLRLRSLPLPLDVASTAIGREDQVLDWMEHLRELRNLICRVLGDGDAEPMMAEEDDVILAGASLTPSNVDAAPPTSSVRSSGINRRLVERMSCPNRKVERSRQRLLVRREREKLLREIERRRRGIAGELSGAGDAGRKLMAMGGHNSGRRGGSRGAARRSGRKARPKGRANDGSLILTRSDMSIDAFTRRTRLMQKVNATFPRPFVPSSSRPRLAGLGAALTPDIVTRMKRLFFDRDGSLRSSVRVDVDTSVKNGYINFSNHACLATRADRRWQVPMRKHAAGCIIGTRAKLESLFEEAGVLSPFAERLDDLGLLFGGTEDQSLHHDTARQTTGWLKDKPITDKAAPTMEPVPGWEIDRLEYNEAMSSPFAPGSVVVGMGDTREVLLGVQKDQVERIGDGSLCRVYGGSGEVFPIMRENDYLVVLQIPSGCMFTGDFPHAGVRNFQRGSEEDRLMDQFNQNISKIVSEYPARERVMRTKAVIEMMCKFKGLASLCRLHCSTETLEGNLCIPQNTIGFTDCWPNPPDTRCYQGDEVSSIEENGSIVSKLLDHVDT